MKLGSQRGASVSSKRIHSGWLAAHAKINLSLSITGQRLDGYHLLHSHVAQISLADRLACRFDPSDCQDITIDMHHLPQVVLEQNLAYKVARAYMEQHALRGRLHVRIFKRIPVNAGLGGGSSDAAAVLSWLHYNIASNRQWHEQELYQWAAAYGADIPLFLKGSALIMQGVGEQLSIKPYHGPSWLLLLKPPANYSTKEVYALYDKRYAGNGADNELELPALELCPELSRARKLLENCHEVQRVFMSGSGATMCALFHSRQQAWTSLKHLHIPDKWWCHLACVYAEA